MKLFSKKNNLVVKENEIQAIKVRDLKEYLVKDFEEIKTSSFIRSKLDDYGIPYTTSAKTGTVALIKGKNSNKTVLLRADIDGLPIKANLKSNRNVRDICTHADMIFMQRVF